MTRNVKLRVHSNDPVSWIGPSGMDDIIPGSHFFLWLWLIFKSVFIKNSSFFFVSIKTWYMKPGLLSKEQNAAVNICFVLLIIFSAGKIHAQMFCPCGLSLVVQALSEMSLNL